MVKSGARVPGATGPPVTGVIASVTGRYSSFSLKLVSLDDKKADNYIRDSSNRTHPRQVPCRVNRLARFLAPVLVAAVCPFSVAAGLEPFDIEVYCHGTALRGESEVDTPLNSTARGHNVVRDVG